MASGLGGCGIGLFSLAILVSLNQVVVAQDVLNQLREDVRADSGNPGAETSPPSPRPERRPDQDTLHGIELYTGYEYLDVDRLHNSALVSGVRIWF
jgi:hypothetical protein